MTRRRFICYKLVIKNKYNATKKELCNSTTDWVINNCCCTGQSVFSAIVAWPPGDNRKRWMATDATNGQSQCRQRERTRKNGLKPIIYCADSLFANNSVLITSERLSLDGLLLRTLHRFRIFKSPHSSIVRYLLRASSSWTDSVACN